MVGQYLLVPFHRIFLGGSYHGTQIFVEEGIVRIIVYLCFGSETCLLYSVGKGFLPCRKELAQLHSVYLSFGCQRTARQDAAGVCVGVEDKGVCVPVCVVVGLRHRLRERCPVLGEVELDVVAAVACGDAEYIVLPRHQSDSCLDGSSRVGTARQVCLQVVALLVAAIAYDLELRFAEWLPCSAGPAGEAEVKFPIREEVPTSIIELTFNFEGIAKAQFIRGVVLLAVEVNEMESV